MSQDVVVQMYEELRRQRPPIADADSWGNWIAALSISIAALPTERRRVAALALVAQDIASQYGLDVRLAYAALAKLMWEAGVKSHERI